jgi:hypothetical protein
MHAVCYLYRVQHSNNGIYSEINKDQDQIIQEKMEIKHSEII